jgi:serine/threonine protein kinase
MSKRSLKEILPSDTPDDALDLISKLLTWDPKKRLNARQVLDHPFLETVIEKDDKSKIQGQPVKYYDFEFEQYTLDNDILREMILDEIIMSNCKEAREANRHFRLVHEDDGVLERLYDRSDKNKRTKTPEK